MHDDQHHVEMEEIIYETPSLEWGNNFFISYDHGKINEFPRISTLAKYKKFSREDEKLWKLHPREYFNEYDWERTSFDVLCEHLAMIFT